MINEHQIKTLLKVWVSKCPPELVRIMDGGYKDSIENWAGAFIKAYVTQKLNCPNPNLNVDLSVEESNNSYDFIHIDLDCDLLTGRPIITDDDY